MAANGLAWVLDGLASRLGGASAEPGLANEEIRSALAGLERALADAYGMVRRRWEGLDSSVLHTLQMRHLTRADQLRSAGGVKAPITAAPARPEARPAATARADVEALLADVETLRRIYERAMLRGARPPSLLADLYAALATDRAELLQLRSVA